MKAIATVVACSLLLGGCALFPSAVDLPKVSVVSPTSGAGPISSQLSTKLTTAAGRRDKYVTEYDNLNTEQHVRDGAILATSVGLSSTAVFRGNANSLKWAGFLVGLTGFYDKAIPLGSRINAARTAVFNFNTMISVGNEALAFNLDSDAAGFDQDDGALANELAAAKQMLKDHKAPAAKPCAANVDQLTCIGDQLKDAQADQANASRLQAAIDTGGTTLTNGKAAAQAIRSLPPAVDTTSTAIETTAISGLAIIVDPSALTGFQAAPPPKTPASSTTPSLPAGAGRPAANPTDLAGEIVLLQTKIDAVQGRLTAFDYVNLLTRLKASAPATPAAPPATQGGGAKSSG